METTKGIVTGVSQKDGKYGFTIGKNNWYNGFGECPCSKGDEVEVTYETNGLFKNVQNVYVGKKAEANVPSDSNKYNMQMSKLKNHTNARCSALDNATKICTARNETTDEQVLSTAAEFLKFIEDETN